MRKTLLCPIAFCLLSSFSPVSAQDAQSSSFYANDVRKRVQRAWFPPQNSTKKASTISFSISANGMMSGLKVDSPSDWTLYDTAASKAVENASPFRPLPAGQKQVRMECHFIHSDTGVGSVIKAEK